MNEQEWEDKLAEVQKNSEHWYNKYKELENKIADIKANCDLAIEGRDIKIKELELEQTVEKDQHQEEINLHLHAEDYIKSLEQKLEQTEKDLADYQFNYPKIKELEKENAELKQKNLAYKDAVDMQMYTNKANKEIANRKLTKAKELLQRFIETINPIYFEEDRQKVKTQTEQFLKEIEK